MDFALKIEENYYPQVFLRECKYIEKKVVRHINDNLSDFSLSDESDVSDETIFENVLFDGAISKISFLLHSL